MTSPIHKIPINPDLYYPVKIMNGNYCMAIREIQKRESRLGKYLLDTSNPEAWRYHSVYHAFQSRDKYPHTIESNQI